MLDLFQLRRCEENLAPAPDHPGCIYGEMNKCLRPCQQVVSIEEYRSEAARVEQFLRTDGASLHESAETARDQASAAMHFEEAERMHQRLDAHRRSAGGARAIWLALWTGWRAWRWCRRPSRRASISCFWPEDDGWSRGRFLFRKMLRFWRMPRWIGDCASCVRGFRPASSPDLEHLAILVRWQGSSWRDGEWIGFDSFEKIPYRKIVNAVARVASRSN